MTVFVEGLRPRVTWVIPNFYRDNVNLNLYGIHALHEKIFHAKAVQIFSVPFQGKFLSG